MKKISELTEEELLMALARTLYPGAESHRYDQQLAAVVSAYGPDDEGGFVFTRFDWQTCGPLWAEIADKYWDYCYEQALESVKSIPCATKDAYFNCHGTSQDPSLIARAYLTLKHGEEISEEVYS